MNPDIFIALGINSNNVFEPRPKAKFENIQVKVEPSTLLEDFAASSIAAGKNIFEYTNTGGPRLVRFQLVRSPV